MPSSYFGDETVKEKSFVTHFSHNMTYDLPIRYKRFDWSKGIVKDIFGGFNDRDKAYFVASKTENLRKNIFLLIVHNTE